MNWLRNPKGEGMPFADRARPAGVAELNGFALRPPAIPPDYVAPPRRSDPSQIIEPSEGWWTQAGAFGFRYQGQIPDLPGTIIPLTEQLRLPGPPRLWWIHWFRYSRSLVDEASANYGTWDLRGRVTYGVGGAQNIVEVDVAAGVQMAVVASSLKVDLITYAPEILSDGSAFYDPGDVGVVAGAMFGDGSAGGAMPASFSTPSFEANGAGILAVDVPVPDFARSVVLHTNQDDPALLANSTLGFNNPGVTVKLVNLQTVYPQIITDRGIAIPVQTNQIRITTAAPFPPAGRITLQFMLAL
jgi:hypothetical protein